MYQSRPPVALIPAATTNRTATVRRPSFANPARPSSTEITPEAIKTPRAPIMTWSGWIRSHRRHPNATITTATVNQPSQGAGDEEEEVEVDMSRERRARAHRRERERADPRRVRTEGAPLPRERATRRGGLCTTPLVEQLFVRGTRRAGTRSAATSPAERVEEVAPPPRATAMRRVRRRAAPTRSAGGGRARRRRTRGAAAEGARVPPTPRRRV